MALYATWNPADKDDITLSNGNLTATSTVGGEWDSVRSTLNVSHGKWYWEITVNDPDALNWFMIGVASASASLTQYCGQNQESWGYGAHGGLKRHGGSSWAYCNTYKKDDVIMIALDMDNNKVWWGKNGTWCDSGDPAAGTGAAFDDLDKSPLYAMTSNYELNSQCTANFGPSSFQYTVPNGFNAGLFTCSDWGSDLCTGGTCKAKDCYSGDCVTGSYGCLLAFNDNDSDYYHSLAGDAGAPEKWLGYEFASAKKVEKLRIYFYDAVGHWLESFVIEGTNDTDADWDSRSWTTLSNESGQQGAWKDHVFDNSTAYKTVRVRGNSHSPYYMVVHEMEMFECQDISVTFTFTNSSPTHLSTVYGNSQTLQLTVTISGEDPSYTYDATFYDATTSGIISTVSGTSSGQPVSTNWSTVDGGEYFWYLTATSSGLNDTSSTYKFTKKYKCAGYVEIDGTRTSGIPVRLYLRSGGELIGFTTSAGISGTFEIDTLYNENHYAIAIHPTDSGTNALIYDWITP